jgi:ATPase subunit of ABC transporter with duplicated ATPase domains
LQQWEGGIILVSHEESFYSGWVDQILNIKK